MKILALEGALGVFSVAVADDRAVLARREENGRRALEAGLSLVASALREARLAFGDLDRLAVGTGPGSFTGLRITLSYAKALALGWGLPLVPISSFDLLEGGASATPALTVVRGRLGVICARLRDESGSSRTACGPPAEVLSRLLGETAELTLAGDAEDVLELLAERRVHVKRAAPPPSPAVAVALLARTRDPLASAHAVSPDYGELPAVKVPRFR